MGVVVWKVGEKLFNQEVGWEVLWFGRQDEMKIIHLQLSSPDKGLVSIDA